MFQWEYTQPLQPFLLEPSIAGNMLANLCCTLLLPCPSCCVEQNCTRYSVQSKQCFVQLYSCTSCLSLWRPGSLQLWTNLFTINSSTCFCINVAPIPSACHLSLTWFHLFSLWSLFCFHLSHSSLRVPSLCPDTSAFSLSLFIWPYLAPSLVPSIPASCWHPSPPHHFIWTTSPPQFQSWFRSPSIMPSIPLAPQMLLDLPGTFKSLVFLLQIMATFTVSFTW